MRKGLLFVALIVLATGCGGGGGGGGSTPPASQSDGVERIDAAMLDVMRRYSPPGIAVAVVRNGKLVFTAAYGNADLAGTVPLEPDHLFRVASVSKPITGIAALRAAEDGLLDIEAKAFEILAPYLPPSGADSRIGDITVWHLMHHTGGWRLWSYPDDPLFRTREIADDLGVAMPPSPQDLVRWLAKQPLSFEPGTDFNYTNIGFVALGRVIEQSTGFDYEDFVQRFVLEPAGITTARLGGITREERLPEEVEYQSFRDRIWKSVYDGVTVVDEPAYGGINLFGFDASSAWAISVVDMARLAAATDGIETYPDVISRESFRTMTRVGTPSGTSPVGVAWFLGTNAVGSTQEWNHSGGMPGTTSLLARLTSGVIVAVVSNTARDGNFYSDLSGGLIDAVNGITDWPETDLFPQYN